MSTFDATLTESLTLPLLRVFLGNWVLYVSNLGKQGRNEA